MLSAQVQAATKSTVPITTLPLLIAFAHPWLYLTTEADFIVPLFSLSASAGLRTRFPSLMFRTWFGSCMLIFVCF